MRRDWFAKTSGERARETLLSCPWSGRRGDDYLDMLNPEERHYMRMYATPCVAGNVLIYGADMYDVRLEQHTRDGGLRWVLLALAIDLLDRSRVNVLGDNGMYRYHDAYSYGD